MHELLLVTCATKRVPVCLSSNYISEISPFNSFICFRQMHALWSFVHGSYFGIYIAHPLTRAGTRHHYEGCILVDCAAVKDAGARAWVPVKAERLHSSSLRKYHICRHQHKLWMKQFIMSNGFNGAEGIWQTLTVRTRSDHGVVAISYLLRALFPVGTQCRKERTFSP